MEGNVEKSGLRLRKRFRVRKGGELVRSVKAEK